VGRLKGFLPPFPKKVFEKKKKPAEKRKKKGVLGRGGG